MYGPSVHLNCQRVLTLSKVFQRTLFSFPSLSSLSPQVEPRRYQEQRLLPYTQEQLYNVVSDVRSYPHFVPYCTASRITKPPREEPRNRSSIMEAELTVGFLSFQESYISKVTCTPFTSVQAEATSETPLFKDLKTIWTFQPETSDQGGLTLVTLDLVYTFTSPLHAAVSASFSGEVSKKMVRAFEQRCQHIYGTR